MRGACGEPEREPEGRAAAREPERSLQARFLFLAATSFSIFSVAITAAAS
jgi:hypothetical protein